MRRWALALVLMHAGVTLAAEDQTKRAEPTESGAEPCGQVLKDKSALPAQAAALMATISEYMELHGKWVAKGKSKEAKVEGTGLGKLAKAHKEAAAQLKKIADSMAQAESLPAAEHDKAAMDPRMGELMKQWIEQEKHLAALLTKDAHVMEQMMTPAPSAATR